MFPNDGPDDVEIAENKKHGSRHGFDGRHDAVKMLRRHLLHVFHVLMEGR